MVAPSHSPLCVVPARAELPRAPLRRSPVGGGGGARPARCGLRGCTDGPLRWALLGCLVAGLGACGASGAGGGEPVDTTLGVDAQGAADTAAAGTGGSVDSGGDPDVLAGDVSLAVDSDGASGVADGALAVDAAAPSDGDSRADGGDGGGAGCASDAACALRAPTLGPCLSPACRGGVCVVVVLDDGTSCDDGDPCTTADVCGGGACAGVDVACSDGNPCTVDACVADSGQCVHDAGPLVGAPCDAGDACVLAAACAPGGGCEGTWDVAACGCAADGDCSALEGPCQAGVCDIGAHACEGAPLTGPPCDDGDVCTVGDACAAGACAGVSLPCVDGNPCTHDGCDPATGFCAFDPAPADGDPCDDGDACTVADACGGGACAGVAVPCDDGAVCTADACDPATGACVHEASALDGAACDDGDPCTVADTCHDGGCSGEPLACPDDGDPCTVESCADGLCAEAPAPPGTPCDDASACSLGDVCTKIGCVGVPVSCDDGLPCTTDTCTPSTGACSFAPGPSVGKPCDDGDPCTAADVCGPTGGCEGVPALCEGSACASALCDGGGGCLVAPLDGVCLVGDVCVADGDQASLGDCAVCDASAPLGLAAGPGCTASGAWAGLSRALATTPYGHPVLLACDGCVDAGFADGSVTAVDGVGGVVGAVEGAAAAGGVPVLEVGFEAADASAIVAALAQESAVGSGHPVVLLAPTDRREVLLALRDALVTPAVAQLVPVLLLVEELAAPTEASMAAAAADGLQGVVVPAGAPGAAHVARLARSAGLMVGVRGLATGVPEQVAAWRDEVDLMLVSEAARARAVVGDRNGLVRLDGTGQAGGRLTLHLRRDTPHRSLVDVPGRPSLEGPPGGAAWLGFGAPDARLVLPGLATRPGEGLLIAALVRAPAGELAPGERRVIATNAAQDGFVLELARPDDAPATWRWAVHTPDGWREVAAPAPTPAPTTSDGWVHIVAAAPVDGPMRLSVDGVEVAAAPPTGGVTPTGAPLVVGADGGATDAGWGGDIATLVVASWGPHACAGDADCAALADGCATGSCDATSGLCAPEPLAGRCVVDRTCYEAGASDPETPCGLCDPAASQSAWTPDPATAAICGGGLLSSVRVVARTADVSNANSNASFRACVGDGVCLTLDNAGIDDLERGSTDHFLSAPPGLRLSDLTGLTVEVSPGSTKVDPWLPACLAVIVDGRLVHCSEGPADPLGLGDGAQATYTAPEPFGRACQACEIGLVSHGPLVGATTPDRALLWLRTAYSAPVTVRYGASPDLADAQETPVVVPAAEDDFTAVIALEGLTPGALTYYRVLVAGLPQGDEPGSFRTPTEAPGVVRVAYGSCTTPFYDPDPAVYDVIGSYAPDLLLMIGDNHYANSTAPGVQSFHYRASRAIPGFSRLVARTPTLAVWDNHDFGASVMSGYAAGKAEVLDVFRRWWANGAYATDGVPGIWSTHRWGDVEIFMLDTRTYRSPPTLTMLGEPQLAWLEGALAASTAKVKLLVSSSQWTLGGSTDSWATFPAERETLFQFIMDHGINGVVLLSGDVHRLEVRRVRDASAKSYPLWEFTTSPLNADPHACPLVVPPDFLAMCDDDGTNFGLLTIDTAGAEPSITFEGRRGDGTLIITKTLLLEELSL